MTDEIRNDERLEPLFEMGPDLDAPGRKRILAHGEEIVPALIAVIQDRELWDEAAPGDGFAPIEAAKLLGELQDPRAIEPMYEALYEADPDALLDTALTSALQRFGDDAVAPGIRALKSFGEDFRDDVACVFAKLGVRRRVVFQTLLKNLVKNPMLGATNLAQYGDPEALDALKPMLRHYLMLAAENRQHAETAVSLATAIRQLDGELTQNEEDQLEAVRSQMSKAREIIERVKAGKGGDHHHPDTHVKDHDLGRNDPCWCESGRKYKNCHWNEERR